MINKIIKYIITGFVIVYPVFYLTVTAESYEFNKLALFTATTLILALLTLSKIAKEKTVHLAHNTFLLSFFLLTVVVVLSTLFQSTNIILTLITPLSTSTIIGGFVFFILLLCNRESIRLQDILSLLVVSSCVLSAFVLLQNSGILPNGSYTPAGTILSTAMFLSIISVYLLAKIVSDFRTDKDALFLHSLALLLTLGTTILLTVKLFTADKPIILPFVFGWTIFLEVLKNIKTLFLGIGPTNFVTAFGLAKPLSFNSTPYWNVVFTSSSSFFLNLVTETGILSGLFYAVFLLKSLKLHPSPATLTLLFTLLLLLFLPGSMTVFITILLLLAAASKKEASREISFAKIGELSYLLFLPLLILIGAIFFSGAKFYLAEVTFKQSLDALINNQGERAYNLQNETIVLNPSIDRYRVSFSRTSLALANALAAKKDLPGGKAGLSDTDKQNIPNLVRQAIDQAQTAVVLNRTNEMNWDNFARVYASLMGYAQGAEKWAAYGFQQKLILDPTSPNTYLALASLNIQLKNWVEAENMARRAVSLKRDLANAHYFLNLSLQGQQKYKEAYEELKETHALLGADTEDGKKVASELAELEKLVPKEAVENNPRTPVNNSQTLESTSSPSSFQNLPETLPTISLPQLPQ